MIKVDENLRAQLDNSSRIGIQREVEIFGYNPGISFDSRFVVDELTTQPTIFDDCSNAKAFSGDALFDQPRYNEFFTWEKPYITGQPQKLYRAKLPSESDDEYYSEYATGLVSADMWNDASADPFIEFNWVQRYPAGNYRIKGLFIEFGVDDTVYPADFDIEITDKNNVVTYSESVTNNTSTIYSRMFGNYIVISNLKVTVHKMNRPNVRLRVSQIRSGVNLFFKDEIITITNNSASSPISAEAPEKSIGIKIWDEKSIFDPQNPEGIYDMLSGSELVRDYIYYNGKKTLIGTYRLDGKPTVDGKQVTFNCSSAFWNIMNNCNYELKADATDSITTIANGSVKFATQNLQTVYSGWLNYFSGLYTGVYNYSHVKGSATELIQKAANVMLAMFIENAEGKVTIKQWCRDNGVIGNLDAADAYALNQKLISGEIVLEETTNYQPDCNVNWYNSSGEIAGYVDDSGTHAGQKGGETSSFVIDNDMMVDNVYHAPIAHDLYVFWYADTKIYKIPYLADPTIEVGDFVSFYDKYGAKHYGIVASNSFSYPLSTSSDGLTVYTTDKVTS